MFLLRISSTGPNELQQGCIAILLGLGLWLGLWLEFPMYERGTYVRTPTIYGLQATCSPSSDRWLDNR